MSDATLATLRAKFRALVAGHGCLDAAAQAINDRWGESVCKGTLSRRLAGELPPPPVHHVVALEDELGIYPVTSWLARRMRGPAAAVSLVQAACAAAKEAGEAIAALTGAAIGGAPEDRAAAAAEIDEAIEALRAARAALEIEQEQER